MAENDHELEKLVAQHLDDALDAPAAAALFERLRHDASARRVLLAAATQAAVLPRTALEDGLARPVTTPLSRRRPSQWWTWTGAAALLLIGLVSWWSLSTTATHDVQVAAQADLVVVRGGQQVTDLSWVQAGDRLQAGASGARLTWQSEGTAIELAAGARLVIGQLGRDKHLRLEQGTLSAEVAPQGQGGLTVDTPFGIIAVVGTRFSVTVAADASVVEVSQGAVRVTGAHASAPVLVAAGFALRLGSDGQPLVPAPLTRLPAAPATPSSPSLPAARVHLGADTFRPGDGWEGDLVDGAIRGRPVEGHPVTRVTTPTHRPDGIVRLSTDLRCIIDLTVDQPTTVAVLLVCDDPAGGDRWLGNVQYEQRLAAGTQQLTIAAADFQRTTSGVAPPPGSRIVAVSIMSWLPAADLRLRAVEFTR